MLALLSVVCATTAWAATYTVSPGQSFSSYFTSLRPGDTLTFNPQTPGTPYTYVLTSKNMWTLNGSPTLPIIVQGAPGERITWQMTGCQNVVELVGSNFRFQNLDLTTGAGLSGLIGLRLLPNVSNAVIDKVSIHDIESNAFTANTGGGYYNNVTFSNCEAYNTGDTGECFYVGCQNGGTATVTCAFTNGFFLNNYCHDTCQPNACTGGSLGSGYQVKGWGSHSNTIRNNVCVNVASVCVLLYDDFDLGPNIVEGNWIEGSVGDAGIQVSAGAIIRNNIIHNNQQGIFITNNVNNLYPGKSNRNIQIVGNTIVNNGGTGIKLYTLNPTAGSRVVNNIVIEDSGTALSGNSQTGVLWSNNALYGGALLAGMSNQVALAGGSSTIFQSVAQYNFHPKAGTAVLGAGAALTGADSTIDYSCTTRNSATPTIGAYETTTGPALTVGFKAPCSTSSTSAPSKAPSTAAPSKAPSTAPPAPTSAPTLACTGINCGTYGTCTEPNGVCVCNSSYTGSRCENAPPDPCVGNPPQVDCGAHGTCSNGICTCIGNWTGTLCATAPPPTCTDGIQNSDEGGVDCGGAVAQCPACPSYFWSPEAWSPCSVTCGGGTETRIVNCVNSSNGRTVDVSLCVNAPHNLSTSQTCNPDPCPTYSWSAGAWDACSASCGTGFQMRIVECLSSAGNVTVPDSACTGSKPLTNQTCNTQTCTAPHWVTGAWSNCSQDCGGGTQTRTRQCFDASNALVGDALCTSSIPPISQVCNTDACANYQWKACPTFYPCTAQCNGGGSMVGVQYRDVFCLRDTDRASVDQSLCDASVKPTALLSVCNTQPCTNYNWMADGNFGPCTLQPNGLYQRFRTFHCHAANGSFAVRQECIDNAGKLPIAVLPCTPGSCASPNGCPVAEIADVFNQCDTSMLTACAASTECAAAANLLDSQVQSLGTSAAVAVQCVTDYVNSLDASSRPSTDIVNQVTSKVLAGEPLCVISASAAVVPSVFILICVLGNLLY